MLTARVVEKLPLDKLEPGDFVPEYDALGRLAAFFIRCVDCRRVSLLTVNAPLRHQVSSLDPLTISGSILCPIIPLGLTGDGKACGAHYFVREGQIVRA